MSPGGTGGRIRAARERAGASQAEAARSAGISASYLNLIEHGRRPVAGELLSRIASAVDADAGDLSRGPAPSLVADLRAIAEDAGMGVAEAERFAERHPEWAEALRAERRRAESEAARAEGLADRARHDPRLASALHEVLSTVTAIRASASILAGEEEIGADWTRRFLRNIGEESARLADGADALSRWIAVEEEEGGGAASAAAWIAEAPGLGEAARHGEMPADAPDTDAARRLFDDLVADAAALPEIPEGFDPAGHPDLPLALRRTAFVRPGCGLAVCDASGALLMHRAAPGFAPFAGGTCPLWPLYEALGAPGTPIRREVEIAGRDVQRFRATAICEGQGGLGRPLLRRATMLLEPISRSEAPAVLAGPACRVCPRAQCPARREPSVLPGADAART